MISNRVFAENFIGPSINMQYKLNSNMIPLEKFANSLKLFTIVNN
jgi:hypothetical protein